MGKRYVYRATVTVGDTNMLQNVYFANYFKYQGIVRELWFHEAIDNGFKSFGNGMIIVTKSAENEFVRDFYATDTMRIELQVSAVHKASVELVFRFYKDETGDLHAVGRQKLVFVNGNHRICRIPEEFRNRAMTYLEDKVAA